METKTMKAWRLDRLGGTLSFEDVAIPEPRSGGVLIRMKASPLMSYLKDYVEGKVPMYNPPAGPSAAVGKGCNVGACYVVVRDINPELIIEQSAKARWGALFCRKCREKRADDPIAGPLGRLGKPVHCQKSYFWSPVGAFE